MQYVIMDIGCLECGSPSELLAVVDGDDAVRAFRGPEYYGDTPPRFRDEFASMDWGGQGVLVAFPLPEEAADG